jgi:hypothetical protein
MRTKLIQLILFIYNYHVYIIIIDVIHFLKKKLKDNGWHFRQSRVCTKTKYFESYCLRSRGAICGPKWHGR